MSGRRPRVLLLNMPFSSSQYPVLSLPLLQAELEAADIACDTRYFSLDLAALLGEHLAEWISTNGMLVGDWLFVPALYGWDAPGVAHVPSPDDDLANPDAWSQEMKERLLAARRACVPFVDRCFAEIDWSLNDVVGFTSMFQQTVASLALARRIRDAHPALPLVFGGSNFHGDMGAALHEAFDVIDIACTGEADDTIVHIVDAATGRRDPATVPGIVYRAPDGSSRRTDDAPSVLDLTSLPFPWYDDWLADRKAAGLDDVPVRLTYESSRGCWWGARSHCTFCGLNGNGMAYRSKPGPRMLEEILWLRDTYGATELVAADDILDMRYFRTLLPALATLDPPLRIFYEIKANLSHAQVRALAAAGVTRVQPGIESLSDAVLTRMAKGTTGLQNIQLLKWCAEFGIDVVWNLLHGFPGDRAEEYEAMRALIEPIRHLQPPGIVTPVFVNRFAPMYEQPERFGLTNLRAEAMYGVVYPHLDRAMLDRIAYAFEADLAPGWATTDGGSIIADLIEGWRAGIDAGGLWMHVDEDGSVRIADLRPANRGPQTFTLDGWRATVFAACDHARGIDELRSLDGVGSVDPAVLAGFLAWCVRARLMVEDQGRHLAVAVHTPPRWNDDRTSGARRVRTSIPVRAIGG